MVGRFCVESHVRNIITMTQMSLKAYWLTNTHTHTHIALDKQINYKLMLTFYVLFFSEI